MHGPGYAPQQSGPPSTAVAVVLRVVFVILSVFSCGMLAWGTMLRVAVIRRRQSDWILFAASFILTIVLLIVISQWGAPEGEEINAVDWMVLLTLFALAIGSAIHLLVVDIRHHDARRAAWAGGPAAYHPGVTGGYGPPPATQGYGYPPHGTTQPSAAPGYGYPHPASPASPLPHPQPQPQPQNQNQPHPQPQNPPGAPVHPSAPVPPAPAAPAAPAAASDKPRIDQVRAELDELSDYLRKEQGR
ncbi:hypothetical protein ACFYT4_03960 [Streptomyces sp. NPDC004609]|uniref:hypothetical protein n=1 Tax=Streptomyces sp. NPDC004609 TaxID=3364704 RepID=UPI0036A30F15